MNPIELLSHSLARSPVIEVLVFICGLMWGSFFNVCIYRLPRDQSVVTPRSRCPLCQAPVAWFHNIPVFSYLALGGHCASCKGRISLEYPIVEFSTGLIFLALYWKMGVTGNLLAQMVFISGLWVSSIVDLHHQIIPDEISIGGIPIGFCAALWLGYPAWWESLLGIAFGGGSFLAVSWVYEKLTGREGLGGGDVKLLAMIGAWMGYQAILPVIVLSSAFGSVVGIGLMAFKEKGLKEAIPFGPFLAVGAVVQSYWGEAINDLLFPFVF